MYFYVLLWYYVTGQNVREVTLLSQQQKKGFVDLLTQNPQLAEEWHPTLNGKLLPSDVSAGSGKKAFWKCPKCGYEWEAVIANRTKLGRGCPCCANRVVVKGVNDLETTHPEIAKEWDQNNNGTLTPSDVTYGSGKKVSWKCPRGHVYSATILHRTSGSTKCPVCNSGRHTSFAEQALFFYVTKLYPDAINSYKLIFEKGMELDIYIPKIRLGIEYDGVYWHHNKASSIEREKRKHLICKENGIKLLRIREKRINDQEFPSADWTIYLPVGLPETDALNITIHRVLSELDPKSNMFTRDNPYHFLSDISVDVNRDRFEILSYLAGPVKNSIVDVAPQLVDEWDFENNGEIKPDMIAAGSSLNVHWICRKCLYNWVTPVSQRAIQHTNCPRCAGLVFEKGVNDLVTKNPNLLNEWDYELNSAENLDPNEIQYNSNTRVHWICSQCGNKWTSFVRARTVNGNGCIKCGYIAGKKLKLEKILEKQGCISNPLLLQEWDYERNTEIGLNPKMLPPGSGKRAYWICSKCGYKWKAPIASRNKGSGCRKCADKANPDLKRKALVKKGHRITNTLLIEEWDYTKNPKQPSEYSFGSNEKVYWVCSTCSYSWIASISSRHRGTGCPACAGNILVQGKNDLLTLRPDIAAEWDYSKNSPLRPEQVSCCSNKKFWWICPHGHVSYFATLNHRISGTGCPLCANQKISSKLSVPIDQFSADGLYIKTYPGIKYAAEECQVTRTAICRALKNGTKSAGFLWKYHIE